MSRAYCCEVCDDADPHWNLTRRGDVVTSWACDADLAAVADRMQRDHEVTKLVVRDTRKARGWAGIGRALGEHPETGELSGLARITITTGYATHHLIAHTWSTPDGTLQIVRGAERVAEFSPGSWGSVVADNATAERAATVTALNEAIRGLDHIASGKADKDDSTAGAYAYELVERVRDLSSTDPPF